MEAAPKSERSVIVHYVRYWLPPPVCFPAVCQARPDPGRRVEVVLEPQVLWFCLLRKVGDVDIIMSPTVYAPFVGGPLPAAFVDDAPCNLGEPLRQEQLMRHMFVSLPASSHSKHPVLRSEFSLYGTDENFKRIATAAEDVHTYQDSISILQVYMEKHLRYAVLYLIWVCPRISHNVTRNVVINSMPLPYGYCVYYRKAAEMATLCEQRGYSSLAFAVRELRLMLRELQRILRRGVRPLSCRSGYWLEGSVFANLCVLFSIPCYGFGELLSLHREFRDLKMYCSRVNSVYKVVKLDPPFLCGNLFPISYFVKEPSPSMKALSTAWEALKDSELLSFIYKRAQSYDY